MENNKGEGGWQKQVSKEKYGATSKYYWNVQFKKISIPPPQVNGNSKGGGGQKQKCQKKSVECGVWS